MLLYLFGEQYTCPILTISYKLIMASVLSQLSRLLFEPIILLFFFLHSSWCIYSEVFSRGMRKVFVPRLDDNWQPLKVVLEKATLPGGAREAEERTAPEAEHGG